MKTFKFIAQMFRDVPRLLTINIILSLIVSIMSGGFILAIGPLVDFYIHPDLEGISRFSATIFSFLDKFHIPITLGSLMIIFFSFVCLTTISTIISRYVIIRTKVKYVKDLTLGMYRDFIKARWTFFTKTKQGVIWNAFTQELDVVGNAFTAITSIFAFSIQMIIPIIIPFYISWQVTTFSLIVAAVFSLPFLFLGKFSYRFGKKYTSTANLVMSFIQQNMSSAKIVLGFGNQLKSITNLNKLFEKRVSAILYRQLLSESIPLLFFPFIALMIITALYVAKLFSVPLSDIAILLLSLRQVAISLGNILTYKNAIDSYYPSYETLECLRNKATSLPQWTGSKTFTGFQKEIVIKDLNFSYIANKPVLNDINIGIEKGQMVALVGRSGAGKSTLIDLILGFYHLDKGKIEFDGINILEFDIISYREKIGYVPQENMLFHMSIRENLLWAKEDATDEEIKLACKEAHADEFIEGLANGYQTVVGERGVRLSGGQIQRISLARALLRKPELLILDEATSSLDTQSERHIQEAIYTFPFQMRQFCPTFAPTYWQPSSIINPLLAHSIIGFHGLTR